MVTFFDEISTQLEKLRSQIESLQRVLQTATTPKEQQDDLALLERAIRECAMAGNPVSKTGKHGLFKRKAMLPCPLANMSRHKLERLADELLRNGRIERDKENYGRLVGTSLPASVESDIEAIVRKVLREAFSR